MTKNKISIFHFSNLKNQITSSSSKSIIPKMPINQLKKIERKKENSCQNNQPLQFSITQFTNQTSSIFSPPPPKKASPPLSILLQSRKNSQTLNQSPRLAVSNSTPNCLPPNVEQKASCRQLPLPPQENKKYPKVRIIGSVCDV